MRSMFMENLFVSEFTYLTIDFLESDLFTLQGYPWKPNLVE